MVECFGWGDAQPEIPVAGSLKFLIKIAIFIMQAFAPHWLRADITIIDQG